MLSRADTIRAHLLAVLGGGAWCYDTELLSHGD